MFAIETGTVNPSLHRDIKRQKYSTTWNHSCHRYVPVSKQYGLILERRGFSSLRNPQMHDSQPSMNTSSRFLRWKHGLLANISVRLPPTKNSLTPDLTNLGGRWPLLSRPLVIHSIWWDSLEGFAYPTLIPAIPTIKASRRFSQLTKAVASSAEGRLGPLSAGIRQHEVWGLLQNK